MTITIKINGVKEVIDKLKTFNDTQIEKIDEAVTEATFFIEGEVKESIAGHRDEERSVDTGNFMSSVKGEKTGLLQGEVSSDVEYAGHLENGTSRIPARNHFKNSVSRNTEKIKEFIANKVKEVEL